MSGEEIAAYKDFERRRHHKLPQDEVSEMGKRAYNRAYASLPSTKERNGRKYRSPAYKAAEKIRNAEPQRRAYLTGKKKEYAGGMDARAAGVYNNASAWSIERLESERLPGAYTLVYVLDDGRARKIGYSTSVATKRLREASTHNPTVKLVGSKIFDTRDIALDAERKLHQHFAGTRLNGEWFTAPAADIMGMLNAL